MRAVRPLHTPRADSETTKNGITEAWFLVVFRKLA